VNARAFTAKVDGLQKLIRHPSLQINRPFNRSHHRRFYQWEGLAPDIELTGATEERMPSEQKWYNLTGRVVDLKVEADGDIHIALVDTNGNNIGTVNAEIPVGPKWCETDNLSKAGWSWGCVSAVDSNGRTIWIADAHRDDGKRFVASANEKRTAFLELERAVCIHLLSEQI